MFMKHTISRFFRFFLVAALVAAMAGSLLPSKALGVVVDESVTVSTSVQASGSSPEWVIDFTTDHFVDVADTITVAFVEAAGTQTSVTEELAALAAMITVQSGTGDPTAVTTVSSANTASLEFLSPVTIGADVVVDDPNTDADETAAARGGSATITISADAGFVLGAASNDPTAGVTVMSEGSTDESELFIITTPVSVKRSSATAGSVTQWQIGFTPVVGLSANASLVTLTFSHATVPSDIASSDISVLATADVSGTPTTVGKLLEVAPTRTSKSITFFTPVSADDDNEVTIVVSTTAGVANGLRPTSAATVKVESGINEPGVSAPFSVGQYLRFAPGKAARNATVTVTGGGFTSGTSGSIRIESRDPKTVDAYDEDTTALERYNDATSTGGVYTVDSAGKLTGSFVANAGTRLGGRLVVRDLGSGTPIWSSDATPFAQNASATPSSEDVALGAPVSVTLNDFDANAPITVAIAGGDEVPLMTTGTTPEPVTTNDKGGGIISVHVPQDAGPGTKQVVVKAGKSARFLLSIVTRTLTVSPSTAVPGQAITVSGSGFTTSSSGTVRVGLALGTADLTGETPIAVNTDGTFLYTGKVPFNEDTGAAGGPGASSSIRWTATETVGTPVAGRRPRPASASRSGRSR